MNFVWYKATNTRIDLLLCVPAIVGCYGLSKLKFEMKDTWLYRGLLMAAGPVMAGVAIAGHWFYESSNVTFEKVNSMLNSRLYYGREAIETYGLSFWGEYVKWIGRGGIKKHPDWVYNYVDCSYLKYLIHYGIFFFIILMLCIIWVGKKLPEKKNTGLVIGFLFWLIYGMIDAELFELGFQPFMLLLGINFDNVYPTEDRICQNNETDFIHKKRIKIKSNFVKWRI